MVTGRATVAMFSVMYAQALPERVTGVGMKVGVVEVTIEGEVVWLGVMVPLYPYSVLVGQKVAWMEAGWPAVMTGVEVWAWIEKSTTFTCCGGFDITVTPLAFALALPEAVIKLTTGEVVSFVVTSISTVATAPAASVGIKQGTISPCPCAVKQDPVPPPLVILPVGGDGSDASPVFGSTVP